MKKTSVLALAALAMLCLAGWALADQFTTGDAAIAIPDNTGTVVTCQSLTVPASLIIADTPSVRIQTDHSWVGDLTYELRGPLNTLTVVNRPGRNGAGAGDSSDYAAATPLMLGAMAPSGVDAEEIGNDSAAGDAACGGGDAIGTNDCTDNFLPNPDASDSPVAGLGTDFSDFTGTDAVGVWMLCVGDSAGGDTGTLVSWTLGFNSMSVPVELLSFSVE